MTNPRYNRPMCERPVLILNPRAVKLIQNCGEYVLFGKRHKFIQVGLNFFPYKKFSAHMRTCYTRVKVGDDYNRKYDYDRLSKCYVCAGCRFEYLFILVSCRHCAICVESRRNDMVARVAMESQTSCSAPIMVTLTYEPKWLPHDVYFQHIKETDFGWKYQYETSVPFRDGDIRKYGNGNLNKRDVQLFFKRLRIRFHRAGLPSTYLRYIAVGEYGSKYGRPHYHLLLWNVPFNIQSEHDQTALSVLKSFILDAWRMCIPEACQVEVAHSAARYVTKYMTKDDKHGQQGFMLASRGSKVSGYQGIGSKFLNQNFQWYQDHATMQVIPFVDKWSGENVEFTFGSYALNKLFPSGSRFVARGRYKERYDSLCYDASYCYQLFKRVGCIDDEYYMNYCRDLCDYFNFLPHYFTSGFDPCFKFFDPPELDFDWFVSDRYQRSRVAMQYFEALIQKCRQFCNDFYDSVDDGYLLYLDGMREKHCSFMPPREVTDDLIYTKVETIKIANALELEKEIF